MLDQSHEPPKKSRAVGTRKPSLGSIAESPSKPAPATKTNPKDDHIRARFKLLNTAAQLLPTERIAKCQKWLAPGAAAVEVHRTTDKQSAIFKHLQRCESYSCPVCAYYRAENDRHELSIALAEIQKRKWTPILITVTASHHWGDSLEVMQERLSKAYDATFSGRWYQELKAEWGIVLKIGSWDITIGMNGWHPHKHILAAVERELSPGQVAHLQGELYEKWAKETQRQGLRASAAYGIDVRTADSDIAAYIAKFGREPMEKAWGVEKEIAMAPAKSARLDGMTMFELLAAASGNRTALEKFAILTKCQDRNKLIAGAGYHFKEYFRAFKGVARIHWGKTRELLALDAALEAYAEQNPIEKPEIEAVAIVELDDWKRIADSGDDMRAELAIFARDCNRESLLKWFALRGLKANVLIPADVQPVESQMSMFDRSKLQWQ